MKLLQSIPTKNLIGIDIETVRIEENFDDLNEQFKEAWEYKNKQDGEIPSPEELSDFWERRSSLYAEFSKVCAVSICFLDKSEEHIMVQEFYGEDEVKILTELSEVLDRVHKVNSFRLLGHAAKYFDYPYLCKRYVINGISIPKILDTSHLKPWENNNLCTNQDIWKMGGTGPGSSLQALCTCLNIPISKVDLVGDGVGKAYFNGEHKRIATYCTYDTVATFNIVRKIKKEPIFQFEDIKYVNSKEDVPKDERHVLQRIYENNEITETDSKEIREILGKKRLLKKDRKILVDILHSMSIDSNFMGGDKKEDIERKLKETEELISKL